MDKHEKILKLLAKVASTTDPDFRSRHAAAIVYKGDIISIGVNQKKTHPFHTPFRNNEHSIFLHAETDAIRDALRSITRGKLVNSTLYIARVKFAPGGDLIWGLSKPCIGCKRAIVTFGIPTVIYTVDIWGYEWL